ncbi:hypothetical protein Ddye_012160 [Dipteronia dyeriana]|uniref:Uncharacterized protein n=1 Tax=Dipteronia dyeriana TaxID=168575 RepID=A0AAD9X3Y1_9ROSI|nr:hypothetical protein Ddye_012160 [Dipteronia dyeriana]
MKINYNNKKKLSSTREGEKINTKNPVQQESEKTQFTSNRETQIWHRNGCAAVEVATQSRSRWESFLKVDRKFGGSRRRGGTGDGEECAATTAMRNWLRLEVVMKELKGVVVVRV